MLNRSGYGILRDTWYRSIPDVEWAPVDDTSNMVCKYQNDAELEETNEYSIVRDTCTLNRESLESNIKSKYIEANSKDSPIIQSRSLSLRSVDELDVNQSIFNLLTVWLNANNKEWTKESINEFIRLNEYQITYEDLLNLYNSRESNFMPTRNYDLLDITNSDSDINFKDSIFYDKLIPYSKNPLFAFRNNGQLYNISPTNIPVLTKISPLISRENNTPFKIEYDKDMMNPLFEVLQININKNERNTKHLHIQILFRVKPHYRTILKNRGKIDIYVPNMIIILNLYYTKNKLAKAIKTANYYTYLNRDVPKNVLNMSLIDDKDYWLTNKMIILIDFDLIAFYAFKRMNRDKWLNDKIYYARNDYKDSDREELLYYCSEEFNYDSQRYHDFKPYTRYWPFGNVFEEGHACMTYNSLIKNLMTYEYLYHHNNTLFINDLIHNFFNNFMSDPFNSDLQSEFFITKEQWEEYIKFKDSFMDMKDGFDKFVKELDYNEPEERSSWF